MHKRTALALLAAAGGIALAAAVVFMAAGSGTAGRLGTVIVPAAAFWVTGTVAFTVRPGHPAARRLLLVGGLVTLSLGLAAGLDAAGPAARRTPSAWALNTIATFANDLALAAWFALFATFPTGRHANRWSRAGTMAAYAVATATAVASSLVVQPEVALEGSSAAAVVAPFPPAVAASAARFPVHNSDLFLLLPLAVALLIVRAARARGDERIQFTWPLLAMALVSAVVVGGPLGLPLSAVPEPYSSLLFGLVIATVPTALLIGMLRHRLFDLDLVLRRSLTYGVLWVAIAATYAALAGIAGLVAGLRLSTAATVVVTILAAMLFQPARERLERLADRWIFGDRERGQDLIRRFGSLLEGSLPGDEVAPRIAVTLRDGLGADWARVWLCHEAGGATPAGAAGIAVSQAAAAELAVPLRHGDVLLGFLECGPRQSGGYTEREQEAVLALGRQAGVAIVNSRLAAELAASRARLVHAETEERRRIERDIHDGVQQQMVALMTRLSLARTELATCPERAAETLNEMQQDFRAAVQELREIANGIHPAVLTDRGLVAALEARAARVPIAVDIRCAGVAASARFPPDVEVAAYFGAVEAIGNALKHAGAQAIAVTVGVEARSLVVKVEDDGAGFEPAAAAWRGLRGISDRLDAVAGRVEVTSSPRRGTIVALSLPIGEPAHA